MTSRSGSKLVLHAVGTDTFRPTKAMVEQYRASFAKAGIDISKLRTKSQWRAALDAGFSERMREHAVASQGISPELDDIMKGFPGWD